MCLCLCVCVKGGVRNKMQKVDENKKKAGFMLRGLHISIFFFFFFQHTACVRSWSCSYCPLVLFASTATFSICHLPSD